MSHERSTVPINPPAPVSVTTPSPSAVFETENVVGLTWIAKSGDVEDVTCAGPAASSSLRLRPETRCAGLWSGRGAAARAQHKRETRRKNIREAFGDESRMA